MISNFSLSFSYRTDSSMKNIIYLIYILILCLLLSEKVSLGSQLYAKFIWKTLFNRLWTSWKPATQLIQCQFRMNLDFPVDALCSGFVSMDGSILVPISIDFPEITKHTTWKCINDPNYFVEKSIFRRITAFLENFEGIAVMKNLSKCEPRPKLYPCKTSRSNSSHLMNSISYVYIFVTLTSTTSFRKMFTLSE